MSSSLIESAIGNVCPLWKTMKASEIFECYSNKNNDSEPLLSVTQENGVIPRDLLDGRVVMPKSGTSGYKLVNIGDFVISLRTFQGGIEYSSYRGLVSPAYTVLRNRVEICKDYFRYIFKKEQFINSLSSSVVGIRDGKNISYDNFAQLILPYPKIEEQKKIAEILGTADEKINGIDRRIKEAENLKKGLMQKLFSEGIGHTEFKTTELGTLPASWSVNALNNITSYVDYRGKTPKKTRSGVFLVTARNIRNNIIDYDISKEYIAIEDYENVMSRGKPKLGEILITTEAPLGSVAEVDNENIALAQRIIKLSGKANISNKFLLHCLISPSFQEQLNMNATGSTVMGIKGSRLKMLIIPLPPIDEQKKIAEILTEADNKIEHLKKLKDKYVLLKKGLMQQLLTGQKRVTLDS